MARDFSARTDIDNTDLVNFPDGRLLNSNPPAARNGTAVVEEVYGDIVQIFLKLLRDASITASGNADTDSTSQYLQALNAKILEIIRASTSQATVSLRGTLELATLIETQDGINTTNAVTPSTLNGRTATTARTGILELATQTETNTGTDSTRAVTPSTLAGRTATETRAGIAQISNQSNVDVGLDDTLIVTPLKLENAVNVVGSDATTKLTYAEFQLGTWNMQSTFSISVNHGIADADNIRNVQVIIINDAGNARLSLEDDGDGGFNIGNTLFTLTRLANGQFDSSLYSGTQNRGFISFFYRA